QTADPGGGLLWFKQQRTGGRGAALRHFKTECVLHLHEIVIILTNKWIQLLAEYGNWTLTIYSPVIASNVKVGQQSIMPA
ncbi:hypothetical protein, partial [Sedimenticola hydrogenitrophicus]|uniref:hypothetical protein n=1 Tax=Sedimenticola hydrogenitrophicus TaxID=2967975 RepID=UPI0021A8F73C